MRLVINITRDGNPRVIEEDIELAIGKLLGTVFAPDFTILDQGDGCFTADTTKNTLSLEVADDLATVLREDIGAEVEVEVIEGWPPVAYQSPQGFTGKRMGSTSDAAGHSGAGRGAGLQGKGN